MADEKTPGKASTRAKNKYNAKAYDQFLITVPTGHKDLISAAAKEQGYSSRNEFIVTAINEKIQRYNTDKTQLYTLTFSTTKKEDALLSSSFSHSLLILFVLSLFLIKVYCYLFLILFEYGFFLRFIFFNIIFFPHRHHSF